MINDDPASKNMSVDAQNEAHDGRYIGGTVVTFDCLPDHIPQPNSIDIMNHTCDYAGKWDNESIPVCVPGKFLSTSWYDENMCLQTSKKHLIIFRIF